MKERDNITDGTSRKYKYELVLNEEQLNVIKIALEEYFRIRMNQWSGLAEELALQGVDLSPENPRHKEIFECFLVKRDSVQIVLESIGKILGWDYQTQKGETQLIAEDIWQVVRHELWKNQENRNDWSVDAREPLRMSEEPLPQITTSK